MQKTKAKPRRSFSLRRIARFETVRRIARFETGYKHSGESVWTSIYRMRLWAGSGKKRAVFACAILRVETKPGEKFAKVSVHHHASGWRELIEQVPLSVGELVHGDSWRGIAKVLRVLL